MKTLAKVFFGLLVSLFPAAALAQSSPDWYQGFVPSAAQWNWMWASKQDYKPNAPIAGQFTFKATVNFNAAGDTPIVITLPTGYTRYVVNTVQISGASGDITTATAGLFTAPSGGGVAIVTGASPITVSTSSDGTINNTQSMSVNNGPDQSYTVAGQPILYFNVATPEGSAATANVTIRVSPLL